MGCLSKERLDVVDELGLGRNARMHKFSVANIMQENLELDEFGTRRGKFNPVAAIGGVRVVFPMKLDVTVGVHGREMVRRRKNRIVVIGCAGAVGAFGMVHGGAAGPSKRQNDG